MACCSCHVAFLRKFLAGKKKNYVKFFFFFKRTFSKLYTFANLESWHRGRMLARHNGLAQEVVWTSQTRGAHKCQENPVLQSCFPSPDQLHTTQQSHSIHISRWSTRAHHNTPANRQHQVKSNSHQSTQAFHP